MANIRDHSLDVVKGILISCVVIAHYNRGVLHDVLFLFHMPLFFILSGFFIKKDKVSDLSYIGNRAVTMLFPYACYLFLDWIILRRDFSLNGIAHLFWSGRSISGTYWYITCFLFALLVFSLLIKRF